MHQAELVFVQDARDLLHVRLDGSEICIGSDPTNDVVVPDPSVPKLAAVIVDRGDGAHQLRDLTEGVLRLDGQSTELDAVELADGTVIGLGRFELHFRHRPVPPTQTSSRNTKVMGERGNSATAAAPTATLSLEQQTMILDPGEVLDVGVDLGNGLVLEDDFASSFHCRIRNDKGAWIITDLGSTNGTKVNGLRVTEAELPSPATIEIGRAQIEFSLEAPSADAASEGARCGAMIGRSPEALRLFEMVGKLGPANAPVMITGASGTGKELVARALHERSDRADEPFLALNCGALAGSVIESELFGHEKGAFTGATSERKGAFEAVGRGTLFLDEIGELPLELQPKLLRVLEGSVIRRVGGTKEVSVQARVVAATHRNLPERVAEGQFREDLLHRLFVLAVDVPPLSARPDDVELLAEHFLAQQDGTSLTLTDSARAKLRAHGWPGNVRELRNVILRAVLLCSGPEIDAGDIELISGAFASPATDARARLRRADVAERERILAVLEQTLNNRAEAARILGLSKSTFHDRLKRLGIPLKFADKGKN